MVMTWPTATACLLTCRAFDRDRYDFPDDGGGSPFPPPGARAPGRPSTCCISTTGTRPRRRAGPGRAAIPAGRAWPSPTTPRLPRLDALNQAPLGGRGHPLASTRTASTCCCRHRVETLTQSLASPGGAPRTSVCLDATLRAWATGSSASSTASTRRLGSCNRRARRAVRPRTQRQRGLSLDPVRNGWTPTTMASSRDDRADGLPGFRPARGRDRGPARGRRPGHRPGSGTLAGGPVPGARGGEPARRPHRAARRIWPAASTRAPVLMPSRFEPCGQGR
jgi:hypothetical protein